MYAIIYRDIINGPFDEWLLDSTYRFEWFARLRLSMGHGRMTRYSAGTQAKVVRTNTLRVYEPVQIKATGKR